MAVPVVLAAVEVGEQRAADDDSDWWMDSGRRPAGPAVPAPVASVFV